MFISRSAYSFIKCPIHRQCAASLLKRNEQASNSTKLQTHTSFTSYKMKPKVYSGVDHESILPSTWWGKGHLHTSCIQHGKKNLLKKFDNKAKKKLWYETPSFVSKQGPPSSGIGALKPKAPRKQNQEDSLRTRVLNSVLFKAVSDLLCSHEVSSDVYNLNVDISKVSLPADFSCCRIYWRTSGTSERDFLIQQALDKSSPRIRYLLMSHQILGSVPPLVFIQDKQYAAISQVEKLLTIADFGEEQNTEETNPSRKAGWEYDQVADPVEQRSLFGIDHEALKEQILQYKQRSQDGLRSASERTLSQQQLDVLAGLRRQKMIDKQKKKKKPKRHVDDITPELYLLARYSQDQDQDQDPADHSNEISQLKELSSEDDRRF